MNNGEFNIEAKPADTQPVSSVAEKAKQPLEQIEIEQFHKICTKAEEIKYNSAKISTKDSLSILKTFLLNEALLLLTGKGFGIGFYIRIAIVISIIMSIIFL